MSSAHGGNDEAMYAGEGRHGKQENPAHRKAARGKAGGVIVGVVLLIFVILLTVWLLARSSDDVEDTPSTMGDPAVPVLVAGG